MPNSFLRLTVAQQAVAVLAAMLLATGGVLYFWATANAMEAELAHTRTVADMTEAFRTLAARHGGFYVRRAGSQDIASVGRYLATVQVEVKDAAGATPLPDSFHQKNPFLALADYSEVVAGSPAKAKFRIVSDNFMNPSNMPDLFEAAALNTLRAERSSEFYRVEGGVLRYARPIVATAACLTCHGDALAAPAAVKALYRPPEGRGVRAGGYGYREGELVGLTSVTVPHKTPWQMLASQGWPFWAAAALLMGVAGGALALLLRGVVQPIRRQTAYAHALASAEDPTAVQGPPMAADFRSRNELHRLAHSLMAAHETLAAVYQRVAGRRDRA